MPHSFLSARDLRLAGKPNAFFDLTNGAEQFDSAVLQMLAPDLKPIQGHAMCSLATTEFEIALRSGDVVTYSDAISYRP